jgi:hypothetical protein
MVGKSKNRKRAGAFLDFSQLLRLLINVNRKAALQRKGMEIATFLPIAWEILPPLLLAGGVYLGIPQRLSYTL